jgi:hypothetical protein
MQRAPWHALKASVVGDRQLLLEMDPAWGPHNRLLLSRFQRADALHPPELERRRRLIALGLGAAALLVALYALLPSLGPEPWLGASMALALVTGAALLLVWFALPRRHREPPPTVDSAFGGFSEELARHLPGFLEEAPDAQPEPSTPFWSPTRLERWLPRTAVGMAIALAAAGLATILTSLWVLRSPVRVMTQAAQVEPPSTFASPELVAALPPQSLLPAQPASPSPAASDGPRLGAACECARPASILWDTGIPRLSLLVSGRRDDWRDGHPHISFDLSVINNGNRGLERLSMSALFYEPSKKKASGRRVVSYRPLYFQGPLAPGNAVTWRVEARGASFDVLAPELGMLDEYGRDAAPADAFDALTRDRQRVVRLHASMLQAFLGDERGRQHALELRAEGRELEWPYLDRVLQSLSALRVCEVVANDGDGSTHEIECCIQNVGKRTLGDITLRVRAVDGRAEARNPAAPPPLVFAESSYRLGGELEPRTGRAVELSFETAQTSPAPLLLEYVVDSGGEPR